VRSACARASLSVGCDEDMAGRNVWPRALTKQPYCTMLLFSAQLVLRLSGCDSEPIGGSVTSLANSATQILARSHLNCVMELCLDDSGTSQVAMCFLGL
jgi:hypothetical protein